MRFATEGDLSSSFPRYTYSSLTGLALTESDGCSANAASACSFATIFAISASKFKGNSSCFKRNFCAWKAWRLPNIVLSAFGSGDKEGRGATCAGASST